MPTPHSYIVCFQQLNACGLMTLQWTDGERYIPVDYRIYHIAQDGLTKNDHFQTMLHTAKERGFQPDYTLFDSWYASLANLKLIRSFEWLWLPRLEHNRHVNPDCTGNCPLNQLDLASMGTIVHLKGYGLTC